MSRLHVDFGLAEMQTEKHMKKMAPTYLSKSELESLETGLAGVLLQWIGEDDAVTGQDPPGRSHIRTNCSTNPYTHLHAFACQDARLHTHAHAYTHTHTPAYFYTPKYL
jgi:hypothetical protein